MSYIALRPLYYAGKEQPAGTVLTDVPADLADKLVARGTLGLYDGTATPAAQPVDVVAPPVEVATEQAPLVEAPLEVQNQEVVPTPEQITEDLQALENGSQEPSQDLSIQ